MLNGQTWHCAEIAHFKMPVDTSAYLVDAYRKGQESRALGEPNNNPQTDSVNLSSTGVGIAETWLCERDGL